mmetsp:Transcript_77761/g.186578  ORF Transcript_77761/g.186578 Transcript_77761/m.186578 type:complete len:85 (+) Transcript_77761:671-925(+)
MPCSPPMASCRDGSGRRHCSSGVDSLVAVGCVWMRRQGMTVSCQLIDPSTSRDEEIPEPGQAHSSQFSRALAIGWDLERRARIL